MDQSFEQILHEYEPMISAIMRELNIYKEFETYRHIGRIALWKAYEAYDETRGHFAPLAYVSIQRAMLNEMTLSNRYTERIVAVEQDQLNYIATEPFAQDSAAEQLHDILQYLSERERELVHLFWIEEVDNTTLAKRWNLSYDGVAKRKYRLLQKLRKLAKRETSLSTKTSND